LYLLEFDANFSRKLLLRHPDKPSALANFFTDMLINRMRHLLFPIPSAPSQYWLKKPATAERS